MRVLLSHVVRDVAPEEAARWWSDFREGRDDHRFLPGHRRRILARAPGHVTMEDETRPLGIPLFRETTTAWPSASAVRFVGRSTVAAFEGAYRFEPAAGGTRIELEATITLRRVLRWTDVAARPLVAAILRVDLARHANDMRRDLSVDRQSAPRGRA